MSWFIPPALFRRRTQVAVALHAAVAMAAFAGAFVLRFDFAVPPSEMRRLLATLPLLVAIRLTALHVCGVYRGSWRHVSLRDLTRLLIATGASSLVWCAALAATGQLRHMPRSVIAIDLLAFIVMAGGMRVLARWQHERALRLKAGAQRNALVIGVGQAGERFLRQTLHDSLGIRVVGLIDDAPHLRRLSLHGVPVLGGTDELTEIALARNAELIVIAAPSATGEQMRRIIDRCAATRLEFKVVPSARDLMESPNGASPLRDVRIEDLLGRSPVEFDLEGLTRQFAGRTVLVTGGAGSIGSELARQIARLGPHRIVILERAESPLYFVQLELTSAYPEVEVVAIIGDVTDASRLDEIFAEHRPDYVFHAAAYKHVPLCEAHVCQAVRNNVLGTFLVADCAARHGVGKMVLISTDKAVNPSSVMGATKRLAERIVLDWPTFRAARTDFRAVRFGNVLGSDGSVIPLFKKQLAAGGPLTVTHREVTRYFMSIPEAVQLVLQAAALPDAAGRIAMLDMGEPMRIADLAEQLIRLSGRVPHRDVQIVFTGLRPGEKLAEELMGELENALPTSVEKIRLVQAGATAGAVSHDSVESDVNRLLDALERGEQHRVRDALLAAVPEYAMPEHMVAAALAAASGAVSVAAPAAAPSKPRADRMSPSEVQVVTPTSREPRLTSAPIARRTESQAIA